MNYVKPIIFKGKKVFALGNKVYADCPPNMGTGMETVLYKPGESKIVENFLHLEGIEIPSKNAESPVWCSILKIVRTHYAAEGGEEAPR